MESKPKLKAEADDGFGIKTEQWMKTEDLVKVEMKMEWMPPADSKFSGQEMKRESKDLVKEKVDLWDSMTKLEAIDPGLHKVISADMRRLHAQNYMLEEELACKEKELARKDDLIARKDDLIATNFKQIAELQQQLHTLQPENEMPEENKIGSSREELEGSLNSQLNVPTSMPAVSMSSSSPDSEEQKLIQELLEQLTEGMQLHINHTNNSQLFRADPPNLIPAKFSGHTVLHECDVHLHSYHNAIAIALWNAI